jgi:DNA-directed RNA polymerase subunit RPC12/RpoP
MAATQDLAVCKRCGWEWTPGAGDVSAYGSKHGGRQDITKQPSLKCPFCGSSRVKIEKEKL